VIEHWFGVTGLKASAIWLHKRRIRISHERGVVGEARYFYLERKDSFRPVNDRTEDLQDFEAQDVRYMYKTR
jgi:hypothetical protein